MSVPIAIKDLEATVEQLDKIISHLSDQENVSQQDVVSLRQVIFHLDSLLIKLRNQSSSSGDIVTHDLINYISSAQKHLSSVLVDQENTEYQHAKASHQDHNNRMFASLINYVSKL